MNWEWKLNLWCDDGQNINEQLLCYMSTTHKRFNIGNKDYLRWVRWWWGYLSHFYGTQHTQQNTSTWGKTEKREDAAKDWLTFNLLFFPFFHFFYSLCRGCEETCSAPCDERKKLNPETIYLLKDRGQYYYPSTMAKTLRIKSKDRRNCCYVITLGWNGDLEGSPLLGVFTAVRIGGQEQVISCGEHFTEWVFLKVMDTNVSLLRVLWASWTLHGPASSQIYRVVRVRGHMLIFKNSNMWKSEGIQSTMSRITEIKETSSNKLQKPGAELISCCLNVFLNWKTIDVFVL